MFYLRNIVFAAGVVLASALLLQDAAVADPPDWAPAHGYRNKHHKNHKHHKHADKHGRYQHDYDKDDYSEDEDEDDARYEYHRDRDWQRDAYRDNLPYRRPTYRRDELRTVDQPLFVNGECTPKKATGAEAGAALGGALGAQMGSGNALATVAGTLAGAMLGAERTPRLRRTLTKIASGRCWRAPRIRNRSRGTMMAHRRIMSLPRSAAISAQAKPAANWSRRSNGRARCARSTRPRAVLRMAGGGSWIDVRQTPY